MEVVRRLANHARSLILDVDSNIAMKNSYGARCNAAVVSHNANMVHTIFKKL